MAIYHLSVSNVSRASGSRATATLSYITGKRVHDERRGETYDYGRKERVLRVGTLLPEGAPAEFADPAVLFNAVELHETGRTARPAKKIVVALPREFTPRQRVQALEEYIRENLNADGYAATYAIHEDREGNNPHAHILVANRQIDPATGGWARLKQRMEYVLDERGERVPLIDPETGRQKTDKRGRRQWKRTSVSLNPLDRKAKLKALRESWAKTCNARLDETARIDHRSLEDQGSDLEPTIHEGYAARAIERAGGVSERCEANREIRRSNGLLTAIRTELGRIFDRLGELFAAKIRQLRQRQARPEPAREPNWRYFEGDARRQLEADRADHTAAIRGKLMGAKADVRNREEWWRSHGTEEFEAAKQIIDVARAASREARDANVFKRGRLLRNAEQVAGEQSEKLRGAVPWLEDTDIPSDWDQANRFRMRATKAIHDHDMQPRTGLVDELERRLEQAERAEGEKPSPEQVKALALRMAEQRERAAEDPTQDMNRPEPSGDEPLDLSEPEDLGGERPVRGAKRPQDQGRPAQGDQAARRQAHRPAGGRTAADRPMAGATAPEARTRPLEQPSGVPRMMFAVARVKRAETAFPGLHGAVEVVTRGRHVEQLRGREHLAVPRHARPMALAVAVRLPRLHGPGVDHRRGLAGEREHEARQPAFHVLALDLQAKERPTLFGDRLQHDPVQVGGGFCRGIGYAKQSAELIAADLPDSRAAVLLGAPVELLGVLALEVGELGQLEARELAGQVVEQERELLVDPNRESRLLRVGDELREQRELDDLARILEHVVQRQQARVRLHDLVGQLLVGQVLPQSHEAAQLLERELHRGRALLPHP